MRLLADRRLGVGADQVLALAARADGGWDYRIWNADGGEVGQCGNGARAAYAYLARHGRVKDGVAVKLRTSTAEIEVTGGKEGPRAQLGVPEFKPAAIPLRRKKREDHYQLEHDGAKIYFDALSLGNPHACVWTEDIDKEPFIELGKRLNEEKDDFPEGVNLSFIQPLKYGLMAMWVYERGAGEDPRLRQRGGGRRLLLLPRLRHGRNHGEPARRMAARRLGRQGPGMDRRGGHLRLRRPHHPPRRLTINHASAPRRRAGAVKSAVAGYT